MTTTRTPAQKAAWQKTVEQIQKGEQEKISYSLWLGADSVIRKQLHLVGKFCTKAHKDSLYKALKGFVEDYEKGQ